MDGAFCYALGTHEFMAPLGPNLSAYPEPQQSEIREKIVRIEGRAGDVILFDDRGFHGPDQPCKSRFGDARGLLPGGHVRIPTSHSNSGLTSDLGGLTEKQLRCLVSVRHP